MKNLAHCKPSEFLKQTNRLRKSAANWLDATQILEIRKELPKLKPLTGDEDEKAAIRRENEQAIKAKVRENMDKMLDRALEEHADETLELLALACFIEPSEVDKHEIGELLQALGEMLSNEAVLSFFTSLARLGQSDIFNT